MKASHSIAIRSAQILIIASLGAATLTACSGSGDSKSGAPTSEGSASKTDEKSKGAAGPTASEVKEALTVSVENPKTTAVTANVMFNGNVAPWQEVSVSAEAAGLRIAQVLAGVGDRVKKGQVLVRLNDASVQSELAAQRAVVADVQAQLADAKANADRARQLDKTGAISASQIEQFLTLEKTAKARLDAAIARQRSDEIRLGNARIVAPEDGVVTAKTAAVGAVVQPGVELFRLIKGGRVEFRAEVPASELGKIRVKQAVQVDAGPGLVADGTVRVIGPTVDAQTRNALVYIDLPINSPIKAGMYAKGRFDLGGSQAITVPAASVVRRDGFDVVFVVGQDRKAKLTKVEVGSRTADRVEVKGVGTDTRVVTTGAGFVNDGDLVRIESATAK